MRRAAKVDRNQAEIVAALRSVGASVQSLAAVGQGVPDLLVYHPWVGLVLMEVKDGVKPPSARRLTSDEAAWIAAWGGPVYVVESVDEALAAVGVEVAG